MIKFYKNNTQDFKENNEFWKILIVDDEKDVHLLTKTVLKNLKFDDKQIIFYSAYSGKEAFDLIQEEKDIAVILLDVIMESDDAGLIFAEKLRYELNNHTSRIILRTGQTGDMPIKDVIIKYDINDYKEKTQLNSGNLYISVLLALRSYKDIKTIINKNIYLKNIISYSNELNKENQIKSFIHILLNDLISLLKINKKDIKKNVYTYNINNNECTSILGEKDFKINHNRLIQINTLIEKNDFLYKKDQIIFVLSLNDFYLIIELNNINNYNKMNKIFVKIFIETSRIILNNLYIKQRIIKEQEELLLILNKLIRRKSLNTSKHLERVSQISYIIAKAYGLDDNDAIELKLASTLHDIGKIDLDEYLIDYKNILSQEDIKKIEEHSKFGYDLLKKSSTSLLKQAAIIAHEHHELWDGSGYPRQLKEKEIHLYARITSLADYYDSLRTPRSNDKAWPKYDAINFLKKNANIKFEASLVDILIKNINEIEKIIEE